MNVFIFALLGISIASLLSLYRLFSGPTVFDRIVAASAITTKTIAVVAILAFYYGQEMYLDISITYAILSFLAIIGVSAYIVSKEKNDGDNN